MSKLNDWIGGLKRLSRDEIVDRVGASNWAEVVMSFDGMSLNDIRDELSDMFPHEPEANDELAQAIVFEFMTGIAAAALGRRGGSVTSEAKTAAARQNAKKGGWPKGRPRKPKVERDE